MITEEDRQFLAYVKAHRSLGYGRMMQIISNEWYRSTERDYPGMSMEGSAFVGTPLAFLPEEQQQSFLKVLTLEEQHGMEY